MLDDVTDEMTLTLSDAQARHLNGQGLVFARMLDRKPDAATLKVVVYDHRSGRNGSVIAALGGL